MDNSTAKNLLQHAEPMAALSITHLTASSRQKLAADDLSVTAYPNEYGGFVYVGAPRYSVPTEPDLATIFDVAEQAGIVWLKFDSDAAGIDSVLEQLQQHWDHVAAAIDGERPNTAPVIAAYLQRLPTALETNADRADALAVALDAQRADADEELVRQ